MMAYAGLVLLYLFTKNRKPVILLYFKHSKSKCYFNYHKTLLPFIESFLDAVAFIDAFLVSLDIAFSVSFGFTFGFRKEVDFFEEPFSAGLEIKLSFASFLPFSS